jgi:tRNA pseudouridine55 synthase
VEPHTALPTRIKFNRELGTNQELIEHGLYLFDKPTGISSFGAVYEVRKVLKDKFEKKIKVGHCGTLDPIATGLLILVSGKLTKRAGELTKMDKTYLAEATLGASSDTYDSEGTLTPVSSRKPSLSEIKTQLIKFQGVSEQIPPSFSAIKINGQRAYKLARDGKEFKIEPRKIQVYSTELVKYSYPKVEFRVHVSSGTYIRTIIDDLGKNLGTGAHMTALRRETIGQYTL